MTKRERLDRLMRAAEMLQFKDGRAEYSCVAVQEAAGIVEQYADFVGVSVYTVGFIDRTEDAQLARQLAVLMYREAVKRGEA